MEQLPFPSISCIKKLSEGGVDSLKACKLLLERGKMGKDVILMLDEIYIQKGAEYSGGTTVGVDKDGKLFKGVMTFMINSLRKSIPFVVKAIPETKIEGKWLNKEIDSVISSVHECGFQVRAVVADNHSTNVSAYRYLMDCYGSEEKPNIITHPSGNSKIYLFYDAVHLMKNIRNNLLNARRFIFPPFQFDGFYDDIDVPGGEISWKLLHDVYDHDQLLPANLRKAPKLSYKTLHPGDNKQSVPLALNIFDRSTAIGITEYFPENKDATEFLKLIDTWWTISNSKQVKNTRLGNAAVKGDQKPQFLRKFADWIEEWEELQKFSEAKFSNSQKFTLSAQTSNALIVTLRCTASLIEDLLDEEGYRYVLTARWQTDPLERRYSRTRQMSGGRFLVGLREFQSSDRILSIISLIKESIDFWKEDVRPENNHAVDITNLNNELDNMEGDIEESMLSPDSVQVSAVIAGYTVRKVMIGRSKCETCQRLSIATGDEKSAVENDYLNRLSRGGLIVPTADLRHYISKAFAILDLCHRLIVESPLPDRIAGETALKRNDCPSTFLCTEHEHLIKFVNRTVTNVYFNNERKKLKDKVRKDSVKEFKQRQTKKRKKE